MSIFYEFEQVDALTTGTVGQPGDRTFYLQARVGPRRVTVKCEKQQVSAIADYLRGVLADLPVPDERPYPVSLDTTDGPESLFVLGPIGLGLDRANERFLVQLEEVVPVDENGEPEAEADQGHIRLFITPVQAAVFIETADGVVAAGRPPCRWCGRPMSPDGHPCPRMN